MLMCCMVVSGSNGDVARDILRRIIAAVFIAAATLPASVVFAKLFWVQQNKTNGGLGMMRVIQTRLDNVVYSS